MKVKELIIDTIQHGWDKFENVEFEVSSQLGIPSLVVKFEEIIKTYNLRNVIYFAYKEDK